MPDELDGPTHPVLRSDSLVGTVLGGRYELLGPLGRGAAGHVYRAVQQPLGRQVAVKVLRTDIDPQAHEDFAHRFLREAALAGRLQHPNVVTVHDFGTEEAAGLHYVVMELLAGRTLNAALRSGPLPPEECARIGIGVARGLRHAHQAGLVHRDVKPTNVMLVRDDDGREQPKLMDFGLVKSRRTEDTSMTVVGSYMGTPAFMAPEQAKTSDVDGRADLYALGVMLYRMLTGKLPFEADHPLGMAVMHQVEPVPPMSEAGVRVPIELESIVRKAMEKRPDDRWPDAGAFADALEHWLHRATLPAPTIPPPDAPAAEAAEAAPRGALAAIGVAAAAVAGLLLVGVGVGGIAVGWWAAAPAPAPTELPPALPQPAPVAVPAPVPVPVPVPVPATVPVVDAPRPRPARPAPAPAPAPAPTPAPSGLSVDGVDLTPADAARILKFVNAATPDQLTAAGVYDQGVGVILGGRPFASIEAFGATRGIGTKTVETLKTNAK